MAKHSIYPALPTGSQVLLKVSGNELTPYDRFLVFSSSLFFVGSVFWVPAMYGWLWKRIKAIPKEEKRKRGLYTALILCLTGLAVKGPHQSPKVGERLKAQKWYMWKAWLKFFAYEVVADQGINSVKDLLENQAIIGVSPHGIFPFGLAFAAFGEDAQKVFGKFRAVVASSTEMIPWVRDVLKWIRAVDASRPAVDQALVEGSRIGLAPGGIAEMFEGYPKHLTHPNEEYIIIRKGIFRMAMKHKLPILPVYCFGSTKLLKRVQFPEIVQKISLMFRVSLVLFFGQFGLPIPFRQRLLYVMGLPVYPPNHIDSTNNQNKQLDEFVSDYCNEMMRIFDRHKESYGWASKTLKILKL